MPKTLNLKQSKLKTITDFCNFISSIRETFISLLNTEKLMFFYQSQKNYQSKKVDRVNITH